MPMRHMVAGCDDRELRNREADLATTYKYEYDTNNRMTHVARQNGQSWDTKATFDDDAGPSLAVLRGRRAEVGDCSS